MSTTADDVGKLIMRGALGALILLHGIDKVRHGIDPIRDMVVGAGLPAEVAYGVYITEVIGPILLILGAYARIGAALVALNMLAAIWLAHTNEIFMLTEHGAWALELQGMFLFTALALILTGPGRFGVNTR